MLYIVSFLPLSQTNLEGFIVKSLSAFNQAPSDAPVLYGTRLRTEKMSQKSCFCHWLHVWPSNFVVLISPSPIPLSPPPSSQPLGQQKIQWIIHQKSFFFICWGHLTHSLIRFTFFTRNLIFQLPIITIWKTRRSGFPALFSDAGPDQVRAGRVRNLSCWTAPRWQLWQVLPRGWMWTGWHYDKLRWLYGQPKRNTKILDTYECSYSETQCHKKDEWNPDCGIFSWDCAILTFLLSVF